MAPVPTHPSSYSILFVDDEPEILETLRLNFEPTFRVLLAVDGPGALAILRRESVAVLVTDQRMGEQTGLCLIREARALQPNMIPIVLTGYVDVRTLIAAVDLGGIHRFIAKPWNGDELHDAIHTAVEAHRRHAETLRSRITAGASLYDQRAAFDRQVIEAALREVKGNKSSVARRLGITYRALVKIMKRRGLPVGKR